MRFEDYKLGEISTFKYGKMPKKDRIKVKGYPIYTGYKVSGYYILFITALSLHH